MFQAAWEIIVGYGPALLIGLMAWPLPYLPEASGCTTESPQVCREADAATCRHFDGP